MITNINDFNFADDELNEKARFHFNFENERYGIHQAKTNPSKFGVKDESGDWIVFARNKEFDPRKHNKTIEEMEELISRGIKHFNILDPVTRQDVQESEWKRYFQRELSHPHDYKMNKKHIVMKLQCGRKNAQWCWDHNK